MITIQEIAAKAGVSTATVSRVFGNHPNIREEIKDKVLSVARKYNYRPRLSLRRRNVVLITPSKTLHPVQNYVEMVVTVLSRELAERNFRIEILPGDNLGSLNNIQFCAAVLIGSDEIPLKDWNKNFDAPLIVVDREVKTRHEGVFSVRSDEAQGMKLAIDHLRSAGHRKIGCLIGKTGIGNPQQRLEYLKQLTGDATLAKLVGPDDYMEEVGKLLRGGVEAIFCPGGNGGIITAYALFLYNKRVPDDIALVASERSMVSRYCIPPQTAISQNYEALAAAVVDVIDARLDGKQAAAQTVLPYHLIERDSVRPRSAC